VSSVAQTARVALVLADYAVADAVGKLNIIGGGWQVTALDPSSGMTTANSIVVSLDISPEHYNEDFSLELTLYDSASQIVSAPGPMGQATPLRISQVIKAEEPKVPGVIIPKKALWSHSQFIANFPGGLPLTAGETYTWSVRLDADDSRSWGTTFYVAGPLPRPVIG
jgi:hypothetical protein